MGKADLFPADDDTNDILGHGASERHATPQIGDEMHELTDAQINKLIKMRFGNNPLSLIRQLYRDVASKEKQLILVRNDKFQREQELLRLCSEYSDLSTFEIEAKISSRPPENDPEKALGEMVGLAVKESFKPDDIPFEVRTSSGGHKRRTKKPATKLSPVFLSEEVANPAESVSSSTILQSPLSAAESVAGLKNYWQDWLNVSEESVARISEKDSNSRKPPVELEKIVLETESEPSPSSSVGASTDKHGFYLNATLKESSEPKKQMCSSNDSIAHAHATKPETEPSTRFKQSLNKLKQLGLRHDAESENISSRWDDLMTQISEAQRKSQSKSLDIEGSSVFGFKACNLKRSDNGWASHFASRNMEATDAAKKFKTLQTLIREDGIPPKYRNGLWMELSGAKDIAVPGEYRRLLGNSYHSQNKSVQEGIEQINLDLHRTLPSNRFFHDADSSLPGPQLAKLRRILYAVVAHMPHIGYSQGMNKIVGNLLLGVNESNAAPGSLRLEEEDVFWIFVAFIDDIIPTYDSKAYFDSASILDIQRDISITSDIYFKKFLPKLSAHFDKLGVDVQVVLYGWWLGIFTECTTGVDTWFKLVDNLLITDHCDAKFIAFSLATLRVHDLTLMNSETAEDAYTFVNRLKQGAVTNVRFKDLNKVCISIESQISASELARQRTDRTLHVC